MSLQNEKEAVTKWCPFARSVGRLGPNKAGPPANRFHDDKDYGVGEVQPYATCLASKCMAWRWVNEGTPLKEARYGYCGLAGTPMTIDEIEDQRKIESLTQELAEMRIQRARSRE